MLTGDEVPELLAGARDSASSAKTAAEAPTYQATVMVLLLITLESLAGGGDESCFKIQLCMQHGAHPRVCLCSNNSFHVITE